MSVSERVSQFLALYKRLDCSQGQLKWYQSKVVIIIILLVITTIIKLDFSLTKETVIKQN